MRGRTNTSAGSGTKIPATLKSYKVAPGNTIKAGNFISFKNTYSSFVVAGDASFPDNSDDFCKINETDFLYVYSKGKIVVTYCRIIDGKVKIISSKQVSEKYPEYDEAVKIIVAGNKAFVFFYYAYSGSYFLEYIPITITAENFSYGASVKTNIQTDSKRPKYESFSISPVNENYLLFAGAWIAASLINGVVLIKINNNNLEFGTILSLKGITLTDRKVNCNVINNLRGLVMAEGYLYNLGFDLPTMTVTLLENLDLKGQIPPIKSRKVFFMDNIVLLFWADSDNKVLYVVGAVCNENGMTLLKQVKIMSNYTSTTGPAVYDLGKCTILVYCNGNIFLYQIESDISLIDTATTNSLSWAERTYKMSDTIGFFPTKEGDNWTGYTASVHPYGIANLDIQPFHGETFAENFTGIIKGIAKSGGTAGEKIDVYVPPTV